MSSYDLTAPMLSRDEARTLTDEVRHDAERLWRKLVELYEGGAHEVLGYSSWGAYFAAEFGQSGTHGYRLLNAARAVEVLGHSPNGERPTESQARELAPLLDRPDDLRAAWEEATENGTPTAAMVREAVQLREPPRSRPDTVPAGTVQTICPTCGGSGLISMEAEE